MRFKGTDLITTNVGHRIIRPFGFHEKGAKYLIRKDTLYRVYTDEDGYILWTERTGCRVDKYGKLYEVTEKGTWKSIPFKLSKRGDKIVHHCSFE